MTPLALLCTLRDLGVLLTPMPDGKHIHVDAPAGVLTDELRQALHHQKEALLDIAEWYEERAGLLEYDGGLSRAEAEREAWSQLEDAYTKLTIFRLIRRKRRNASRGNGANVSPLGMTATVELEERHYAEQTPWKQGTPRGGP